MPVNARMVASRLKVVFANLIVNIARSSETLVRSYAREISLEWKANAENIRSPSPVKSFKFSTLASII